MNKKALKIALVAALAVGCTATACFTGCGGAGPKSYYGKTVTLTGNSFCRGFEQGGIWDNYRDLGETTYKRIAETYWDDIDWTASDVSTAPADVNALKTIIENANPFANLEGLAFTVNKEDRTTISLKLPSSLSSLGWGTSVTMDYYENTAEWTAKFDGDSNLPFTGEGLEEGHRGLGFIESQDGNKRLFVSVNMIYLDWKKADSVSINLIAQEKDNGYFLTKENSVNYEFGTLKLFSKPVDMGDGTYSFDTVLQVNYYPEINIADKQ